MVCQAKNNELEKPTPTWVWIVIGSFVLFTLILLIYVLWNINDIRNYEFKVAETSNVDF